MIATYENIRNVRPIAENVIDDKRLAPYISEVETLVIIPAIGVERYKKIDENKADYAFLLEGGYYANDTKHIAGLYLAIGYLVYSRFIRNQDVNVTAFGVRFKDSPFSERVDEKTIIRTSNDAEQVGMEYLKQCIGYLGNNDCEVKKNRTARIKVIGD